MAAIVRRRNSFSVVYYITTEGQRKQKWETYHSLGEAQRRRELLKIYEDQRRRLTYSKVETVEKLMYEYIRLYGLPRWSLSVFPAQSSASLLVLKQPKTDSSIRTVYLPGAVMERLQRRGNGQPMTGLIFSYSDGRPLQEKTITKWFYDLLEQANLPRVTFHSLRHSSITYKLIVTEGNIKAVQGDSGHAQAEMVTEVYGHILDTCRKETAKRFENAFFYKLEPQ